MNKKRKFFSADTLIYLLCALCVVLAGVVAVLRPQPLYLAIAGGVLLVLVVFILAAQRRLRKGLRRALAGGRVDGEAENSGLAGSSLPVMVAQGERLVWYNAAFAREFIPLEDAALIPIAQLLPGLDFAQAEEPDGQDLYLGKKRYTVRGNLVAGDDSLYFATFVEDTDLKLTAEEYAATRPSVLYFVIDTYDEILKEMKETERARVMAHIDARLEEYLGKTGGFLRKVSNSRYVAVVEERSMQRMVEGRFDILDAVRKADEDVASLSIGVGRRGATLRECEEMAVQALDMALGRGGDQCAVNSPEGFEFYGGLSRSVEKRTKVKSRIVARAIRDLMRNYKRVLIMGHKNSDMDSVGASIGMLRFARICQMQAFVVVNRETSLAESLLELLAKNGYDDVMLHPDDAIDYADEDTLLVVVDTHMPYLLESKEIYEACGGTVLIDHHRRMVGHIGDALVFHHEPYASSASELVSELLQYVGENRDDRPTPVEAEAMLAGIMLDTRTFSLHVGVRTFEASAYLRRMGAQTATVKKLFTSTMDEYIYRCHLVSVAKVHKGCAVVVSDRVPPQCEVVAPQAANDLLTIGGVKASFVAIMQGGEVRISARSMGEVNVQLVMEKLGGGGHLTMAGAQMRDTTLAEAEKRLMGAIEAYWAENAEDVAVKV